MQINFNEQIFPNVCHLKLSHIFTRFVEFVIIVGDSQREELIYSNISITVLLRINHISFEAFSDNE